MNYLSRQYHVNAFEDVVTAKETGLNLGSIKRKKDKIHSFSKEDLIGDLSSIVNQYGLSVLLLNSKGEVEEDVNNPKALDLLVDKYGFKLSFGTDDHFNEDDKHFFKDISGECDDPKKRTYFSHHKMLTIESSYLKLNRFGKKKLKKDDNEIVINFC